MIRFSTMLLAGVAGLCALLGPPAFADTLLKSAPATSVTGTNSQGNAANWTAEGHISYTKGSYMSGYMYGFPTHLGDLCQTSWCTDTEGSVAYSRVVLNSGGGTSMDGVDVTFFWDKRLYKTSTNFQSFSGVNPQTWYLFFDGDSFKHSWNGPASFAGGTGVQYKIGTWQGSGGWQAITATPGL
jgi:hypothetical protein